MRAALIKLSDNSIDRISNNIDIRVKTKAGFKWLPCPEVPRPSYDRKTHILTGPTYVIGAESVTEVWTLTAKDATQLDQDREQTINSYGRLEFEVEFDQENRIRALEGRSTVTKTQYRNALKTRLEQLD